MAIRRVRSSTRSCSGTLRGIPLLLLWVMLGCRPTGPVQIATVSREFQVEQVYTASGSPVLGTELSLLDNHPGELVWLTGASLEALEGDQVQQQFVGDTTLDLIWPEWHRQHLKQDQGYRLFGLGQGCYRLAFAAGFGIPIMSNEPLIWSHRVLNLDPYQPATMVRYRAQLDLVRERGLTVSMHPLRTRLLAPDPDRSTILPGGGQTRFDVTAQLGLEVDERLHAATVQLHPYAVSSELRDLTEDKTLVRLEVLERRSDQSLAEVSQYASSEGVILPARHRFELVTRYSNPTGRPLPGVAYWTTYFWDHRVSLPASRRANVPTQEGAVARPQPE